MISLYPDTLSYWQEGNPTRDSQGHYTSAGDGSYTEKGSCRLEYSAPQSASEGNDKRVLSTSGTIYAPLSLSAMPERGQKVKVVKSIDGTTHELTVVNSECGFLHVRIWVE